MNTTDTRVELMWSLDASTAVTDAQKALLTRQLRHRLVDGTIAVVSSQYRSQLRNREAAQVRLEELIGQALVPPKSRRATKPSRASVERRIDAKKRRGETKRGRRAGWD